MDIDGAATRLMDAAFLLVLGVIGIALLAGVLLLLGHAWGCGLRRAGRSYPRSGIITPDHIRIRPKRGYPNPLRERMDRIRRNGR